jgi:hypothetical protein
MTECLLIAFALAGSAVVSGTSVFSKPASCPASQQSSSSSSERGPHGCADVSAILLEGLKAVAWYLLSRDMFRSEATGTAGSRLA